MKPGFFKNEHLAELSPWHRLCFQGLWLCADREGRLQDRPKRLKGEIFPYDDLDMNMLLWDLSRLGFVIRYQIGGHPYLWIPTWELHQHPRTDEGPSTFPAYTPGSERPGGPEASTFPAVRPIDTAERHTPSCNAGVYFVRSGSHIKVGFSGNCEARVARILRGAPNAKKVGIWWQASADQAESAEAELHVRFANSRINHEWFKETPDLKAFIKTVTSPSLDSDDRATPARMGDGTSGDGILEMGETPAASAYIRAQDLLELWNATTKPPIPRCRELTDERRRKIRLRFAKRPSLTDWREAFEAIQAGAFYRGENDRQWTADFDWVIKNDTVVAKVLERARTPKRGERASYEWHCPHTPHCPHRAACDIVNMRTKAS